QAPRPVVGDDHGGHLPGPGQATAPGVVVALVEGDDDRVVPLAPLGRVGDLIDRVTQVRVGVGDKLVVVDVARAARVLAPRRRAVHVVTLVGDDVGEVG